MITELGPQEVFVFGSNIRGNHAGGAAKQAFDDFGAQWGAGEGMVGFSYAFPTLNENMEQYTHFEMLAIVQTFYRCVQAHPELTFLLTKVGCGIAGYTKEYIQSLFVDLPSNVKKVGW